MTTACDTLIIGGGIVGLSMAQAMAQRQQQVIVVDAQDLEPKPQAQPDKRVYAINHASKALFQSLDVWERMDQSRIAPYQHMHVWDASSQGCIDFDARMVASPDLGAIIDEGTIKQALLQALLTQDRVQRVSFSPVTGICQDGDVMTVSSGQHSWQAKRIIIADGGDSPSRQLLQIPVTTWPYHQHALVATVRTEKSHQKTAWQVFNPDGPLAFLPLADEHHCSIVWTSTPKRAEELQHMPADVFNQAVTEAFAHKLGAVSVEGSRHQFPLLMRHAQQLVGNNWVLMGDAAHTVHPLAGLGLNIGLADVAAFLSCVDATKTLSKKSLMAYQRQRKQAVWQSIALLGGLKTLFANPLPPLVSLRGLGLSLCNTLTPLKRMFIEHATGL